MASGILYLDIDDEITSAAARIRSAEGRRVAIVLPNGSRVATSRINFRLLSRDALTHEKRLSIVASDAATRALAASAGLPVFATVAEYEASEEAPRPPREGAAGGAGETARVTTPSTSVRGRKPRSAPPPEQATLDEMEAAELAAAAAALGRTDIPDAPPKTERPAPPPRSAGSRSAATRDLATEPTVDRAATGDELAASGSSSAGRASAGSASAAAVTAVPASAVPAPTVPASAASGASSALTGSSVVAPRTSRVRPRESGTGRRNRTAIGVGLAVVALVLIVGGVGAYLWLPSATIVVTPKEESVGPVLMTISADPSATAPDALAEPPVVPAQTISMDVTTSGTFPATGKRVETAKATGTVRFRNKDFTSTNTIPAGSVVSTANGTKFRTDSTVTVPRADIVGLQVFPKTATVKITAVTAGTRGNVEANTIVVIPRGEDPISLDVNNPDPTGGGKRDEFPKVTQEDVDNAIATLNAQLDAAFVDQLKDPSVAAPGATVFPETRALGPATPDKDPTTLVDQETESFDLGLTATGTATAVDEEPVQRVAEERLKAGIDAAHRLVADSVEVTVEPAVVAGGRISFPASASARQTALLDPKELKRQVMGKPLDEAKSILGAYGAVVLSAWPDWVSTVPTIDGRVDLTVGDAVTIEFGRTVPELVTRLLGVDLGERRVGIALADGDGAPALPLTTIRRSARPGGDADAIGALVRTHDVGELVVGLPLEASGAEGRQAILTRAWADALAADLRLPLTFRDERLTSHLAEGRLGPMPRGRSGGPPTKAQRDAYRARVDREAAAIILQDELDARAGITASRTRPSDPSESRP